MEINREYLERQEIGSIRSLLVQRGANYHHKEKKDTLINRLIELASIAQPSDKSRMQTQEPEPETVAEEPFNIYDELRPWIERGLNVDVQGEYVEMSYGKRQDSGNIHYPKQILIRMAKLLTGYHGRD
jgi:hypothetical protein